MLFDDFQERLEKKIDLFRRTEKKIEKDILAKAK